MMRTFFQYDKNDTIHTVLSNQHCSVPSSCQLMLSIYNPLFSMITNGAHVVGQHELVDGISTGRFMTVDKLCIGRDRGQLMYAALTPATIGSQTGYVVDIKAKCNLGVTDDVFLTTLQQSFYSKFFFYL